MYIYIYIYIYINKYVLFCFVFGNQFIQLGYRFRAKYVDLHISYIFVFGRTSKTRALGCVLLQRNVQWETLQKSFVWTLTQLAISGCPSTRNCSSTGNRYQWPLIKDIEHVITIVIVITNQVIIKVIYVYIVQFLMASILFLEP